MKLRPSLLVFALALSVSAAAWGDEVVLKNGRSIRGTVLKQDDREVVLRLDGGQKLKLPRAMVKSIKRTSGGGGSSADKGAPRVRLRWAMKPGQSVQFRSTFTMESKAVKGGASLGLQETRTDLKLTCAEARVADLTLDLTLERVIERKVDKAGKQATRDSKAMDPADRPKDMSLVGKSIRFRLSARGEVLELVSVGKVPLAKLGQRQQRLLEKAIGDYVLRLNLMGLLGVFPKAPAKLHTDRWKDAITINDTPLGDLSISVSNSVERVGGGEALIRQTGTMEVKGLQKRRLASSKVRGRIRFSTRDGCLVEVKQTSTGRFRYGEGDQAVEVDLILAGHVLRR